MSGEIYIKEPPVRKSSSWKLNATIWLVVINVLLFILFYVLISTGVLSEDKIALSPSNIFQGKYLWTFLTSMFMHANLFHLFVNMISLLFVGKFLEMIIGKKRFVKFYLISGIFAGLFFACLSYFFGSNELGSRIFGSPEIFAVGASGAIFAVAGVLSVLTPNKKVSLIAGPIIAIIVQVILTSSLESSAILSVVNTIITIYIFACIFFMFSFNNKLTKLAVPLNMGFWLLPIVAIIPLFVVGFFFPLPIGNTAHLGGLIAGLIYGFYLRARFPNKLKMLRTYLK